MQSTNITGKRTRPPDIPALSGYRWVEGEGALIGVHKRPTPYSNKIYLIPSVRSWVTGGEVTCLVGACRRDMWSTLCIPCKVSSCLGNLHPYTGYQKTYPHLVVYPILEANPRHFSQRTMDLMGHMFILIDLHGKKGGAKEGSHVHRPTWEEGRGQRGVTCTQA